MGFVLLFCLNFHLVLGSPALAATSKVVVFLGDSLTEGYGLEKDQAYPHLIAERLKKEGHKDVKVINAGISGSTSASAPSRLKWLLKSPPAVLFLALGANDGLRGVPASETRKNLSKTIEMAQAKKVKVILAGMQLPPNYGKKYREDFQKIFADLARTYKVKLVPFLLKGVAADPKLNQPDGIHPNEKGHEVLARTVYPFIKDAL